jgi:hypothetical protein
MGIPPWADSTSWDLEFLHYCLLSWLQILPISFYLRPFCLLAWPSSCLGRLFFLLEGGPTMVPTMRSRRSPLLVFLCLWGPALRPAFPSFVASFVPFSWYHYQIQSFMQCNITSSAVFSCHEFMAVWLLTANCHVFLVLTTADETDMIRTANSWHQNYVY